MPIAETPESAWRLGLRGARANLLPAVVLQAVALALVVAFYRHPPTHDAIEELAVLHERYGVLYGIVSTAIFGGVIPVAYLKSRQATADQFTWAGAAALIVFWGYKGFEIDLWYHVQARVVGEANTPAIVLIKMVLDQFVYCPVLAVPLTVAVFEWIHAGFRFDAVRDDIRAGGWYRRRVFHVLVSNLGVWVPAVCIIYALPTALQLPLQNLVLCFFTLLLAHIMPRRVAPVQG